MEWTKTCPKKRGFYWVFTDTDHLTIYKRSGKSGLWSFAGQSEDIKSVKHWGSEVQVPEHGFMTNQPEDEGWFAVTYEDKSKGVVLIRVAKGTNLHCYDFEIPSEIDIRVIVQWNGPLKHPDPPKPAPKK